jgi:hypothetical protein
VVCLVHLVCFVHLVNLVQPNKPDKPNKPEQLAGSHISQLFATTRHVVDEWTVDVRATEADGIKEDIVIRHKVPLVG